MPEFQNFQKYFRSLLERPFELDYPPLDIYIELTNHCNLRCTMCPNPTQMKRKRGFMDKNLYRDILHQIYKKVKYLRLFLFGEATIHPQFIDFLQYARNMDFSILVDSTLYGIDKELLKAFVDLGLNHLRISLDATNRSTYQQIKGRDGWDQINESLNFLISYKQKKNATYPYIILQCIKMGKNSTDAEQFEEYYKNTGANRIELVNYINLKERIREKSIHQTNTIETGNLSNLCYQPWRHLAITWSGQVTPCCQDYDCLMEVGKISDSSIFDIWNGQLMKQIRKDRKKQVLSQLQFFKTKKF